MRLHRIILALICAVILSAFFLMPEQPILAEESDYRALFINVGKADAILLMLGEERYLVDTGTKDTYDQLENVLGLYGVSKLDAVFITHTDKDHVGGLKKLEQSGMMVFVRSVYLQGLVFQKPETLAPHMEFARPTLEKFQYLCKKYELTPAALALSYALSLPGVTSLVLGSEKAEQVRQNLELMDQAVELSAEQMAEIRELFLDTPEQVLNPALWPKP